MPEYITAGISTNSDVLIGDNATVNEEECGLGPNDDIHLCIDGDDGERLFITIDVEILKSLVVKATQLINEYEKLPSYPD